VWSCWRYIEHNPVRAGMVRQAGSYRFCSYGYWCQTGRHPFPEHVASVLPMLGVGSLEGVFSLMTAPLEEHTGGVLGEISKRVRYWVDGLVIGSELFVRGVMADHHPCPATRRMMTQPEASPPLACWRRLRVG